MGIKKSYAYIARTRYRAGIFLSEKIANRKKYAEHIKLEKFEDFTSAESEFFDRYKGIVNEEEFRVNVLYEVRAHPGYDVFWSKYTILIGQGFNANDVWIQFFKEDGLEMFQKHFENYEDAQIFARSRFIYIWKDYGLWIRHRIKIGVPVNIDDEMFE